MLLVYMAKPSYGGWVAFTSHLSLKYDLPLVKIGKRTEKLKSGNNRLRKFGYDVSYQNVHINDIVNSNNILITAIDKNYYKYLEKFPDGTKIVIHDPTEVKGKSCQPVIDNLHRFKVYTIRKTVQEYLLKNFGINSKFLVHPFHQYKKNKNNVRKNFVSISRVDFDKNTDIIVKANQKVSNPVHIYGKKNDLYVHFHIDKKLNLLPEFENSYHGTFGKTFSDLDKILSNCKAVVDMSSIKNDGGGSQYTFLEAIYQECVLILNKKWVEGTKTKFIHNKNCLIVKDFNELAKTIENNLSKNIDYKTIAKNAKKLLKPHIEVDWINN